MKALLATTVLISLYGLLSTGLRKHEEKIENTNKLTSFFQENSGSVSTSESYNMKKDRESNRHKPHMNNSTEDKDQESNKELLKIKNPEGEKEKYKDSKKHLPNIRNNVGKKENNSSNETKGSNMPVADIRKKNHTETSQDTKKQKAAIRQLLCELFNISKESEACKEKHHSKKAMIWPTKMIPWLKKVLITKLNRGLNNRMSFLDKMEDPTESPFGGGSPNSLSDNWDGNPFLNMPRKHRNGLKMVPLLKTLKAKLYGQRTPGDFGNLNDALNGEGLNGFGPVPTQGSSHLMHQILSQALGSSDRNSVLNEMMQEFLLANNREESEGNEGFADLTAGTNSFSQFNNGLQQQSSPILPEPNQGIGFGQLGGMNMLQGNIRTPMASEQPIHAQMLDNGAIAPMSSQSIGNSPLKPASFLGGRSPIGRSPLIGSPLLAALLVCPPCLSLRSARQHPEALSFKVLSWKTHRSREVRFLKELADLILQYRHPCYSAQQILLSVCILKVKERNKLFQVRKTASWSVARLM
ncbi:hypothetical protein OS493_006782 [Desmophyllum pertusum]|uniref:Uncharacterized protein n=1 Tax=Desmophyllum pertusum TaxID=174260 RepID=A0A9X0D495_9CNID|nr:hypothetical protein OS493_006782 [Desmophyllum pertusum]